jgi:hypothetical protein
MLVDGVERLTSDVALHARARESPAPEPERRLLERRLAEL